MGGPVRWKLIDRPNSVKMKKSDRMAIIKTFADIPVEAQTIFKEVKKYVCEVLGETKCYAFGSWTKGTQEENSDFDVFVYARPTMDERRKIITHKYNGKVDVRFVFHQLISNDNAIEIV